MKTNRTPLTQRAKRFRLAAGLLTLGVAAAGCTILAPIQEPEHDRRFAVEFPDSEQVPCVDPDGRSRLCDAKLKDSLDGYVGDLGRAMWETDLRRRRLVTMGAEKAKIANLYNALLWPLGAYFVTRKIHHPEWSTLDTAAVGTATYGLLNSGIPERDKLYVRAASRMACAMVLYEPLLYRRYQIDAPYDVDVIHPETLEGRINRLEETIRAFRLRRDVLVSTLKASPGKAAPPAEALNSITAVRSAALGRGKAAAGGVPPGDLQTFVNNFQAETDRQLASARSQLTEARTTLVLLRSAGIRLRQARGRVDAALNEALMVGTPALVTPEARARDIATALQNHLAATKSFNDKVATLRKQSGTSQDATWTLTDTRLQALNTDSQQAVLLFWSTRRVSLDDAQELVSKWRADHQERVKLATDAATGMGCSEGTLDEFSRQLLQMVNDAAEAAVAAAPAASGASK
ncbi:hypothetical protein ACFJGW_12995 [Burkholderiaceae bacterium UC74_6]